MIHSIASPPTSPRQTLAVAGGTARMIVAASLSLSVALTAAAGSQALAQQQQPAAPDPGTTPPPKHKPAKKPVKPGAPTAETAPPAQPAQAQQQPAQPGQPAAPGQPAQAAPSAGQQQVQLIYSAWTKFCLKGQPGQPVDPNAKQVCFTGKEARLESGLMVVAAVLIEPEGQDTKILQVTLPLGMELPHGTRVTIDQNQPMTAPFQVCGQRGCMSNYPANAELISKLKSGQALYVQAIQWPIDEKNPRPPLTVPLALNDFAKAYDGPPTDPKVLEEQQSKLQEELQRRAEEARKKLENQQGAPAAPATPSAPQASKTQ